MLRMSEEELNEFKPSTVAEKVAKQRVLEMLMDNNETKGGSLMVTKEVTDRIEGKAAQSVRIDANITNKDEAYKELTPEELRKLAGK